MLIASGQYQGKDSEKIFFDDPSYVDFYMSRFPHSKLGLEFARLKNLLDAKPFTEECRGCKKPAVRATGYIRSDSLDFWCAGCDPYDYGATPGKLKVIKTFSEAIDHIELYIKNNKSFKKSIIRRLATGKGLPSRLTASALAKFFS